MKQIAHIAIPISGVGLYIDLVVKNLDDKQFSNLLIGNKFNSDFDFLDKRGAPAPRYKVALNRELNILNDVRCLFQIIRILKKTKPDLIHCHSAKAGVLGRIAGACLNIPTLYTPHAFSYLSTEKGIKRTFFKSIESVLRIFPAFILACSESEQSRALNDLNFNKNNILLWQNSIEELKMEFTPNDLINLPKRYVCSSGRISYQKNFEMLIETIFFVKQSIKNIHLVLIGVGDESRDLIEIEKSIEKRGLKNNVTLIPWIKREDSLKIIEQSRLYLSSSLYEGLSYSVIEALALAKPCIVTNVDGNKDLIINGFNGYLVDIGNSEDMAEKIIMLLENEKEHKIMSKNALDIFRNNHNIKKNIGKLEEIYLSKIS